MQSDSAQVSLFYDTLGWLETHKKQTVQGVAVVAFLAVIVSYYFYSNAQKEDAAAAGFARLILQRAPADEYIKFQASNSGTLAGPKALLMGAQEMFSEGKYPEAQAAFQKLRQEYRNSTFAGTAALGVAASLDAQGKADEAISAYADLAHRTTEITSIQAEFALGRLYEGKGQFDKAVENYDAVAQAGGNSGYADESYVRAAELRAQHPNLVKTAPAMSPVAPGQQLPPAK